MTLSGSKCIVTDPAGSLVATSIIGVTATFRDQMVSKRNVTLRGCTSRTTASTPSGSVTSPG